MGKNNCQITKLRDRPRIMVITDIRTYKEFKITKNKTIKEPVMQQFISLYKHAVISAP